MFDNDGPFENTTIYGPIDQFSWEDADPDEFEEVEDENGLCDCDPKYKETQTVQRSAGAKFGGFGGQLGDGTTVIICTNCGGRFYEDESDEGGAMGMGW